MFAKISRTDNFLNPQFPVSVQLFSDCSFLTKIGLWAVKSVKNAGVFSSISRDSREELVSISYKDSNFGYFAFALGTSEAVESAKKAGEYARNIKLTVENSCKDGGNNAHSDRNLHVRFSEQN